MAARVVSFHCVLKNSLGQILGSTFNQDVLTEPATTSAARPLAAVADALADVRKGERRSVRLRAEQAYGFYDLERVLVRRFDEIDVSAPLALGDRVLYVVDGRRTPFRVTEITGESVTLDGNHPLAGQDLVFEIETLAARDATPEEISEADSKDEVPRA